MEMFLMMERDSPVYTSLEVYVRLNDDTLWSKKGKYPAEKSVASSSPIVLSSSEDASPSNSPSISASLSGSASHQSYRAFVDLVEAEGDAVLQRAIEQSLLDVSTKRENSEEEQTTVHTLSDVLREHVDQYIFKGELGDEQLIPVRCQELWKDVLRCINTPTFVFDHGVRVKFIGEEAVDAGGPLREFFRLLMIEIGSNMSLMCGSDGHRTALHNAVALDKKEFYNVGRCIALSIVYGGPGPNFFSDTAANYLLGLPITTVPKDDIPDPNVASAIEQIKQCDTTESMRKLLDSPEFSFRFDAGCPMPSSSVDIDDKETISKSMALNYIVFGQKAELDGIKCGFDCVKFSAVVQSFPTLLKPLFIKSGRKQLTTEFVLDLFYVEYSPQGCNRRPREEEIILHWNYYVSELEAGREIIKEDGSGDLLQLGLGDLLSFVTGADHPPPLGFKSSPEIEFTDDSQRILPKASTCTLTLYLSLHLTTYEAFRSAFDTALISAHGFGQV